MFSVTFIFSCSRTELPQLNFNEIKIWHIPPAGKKIPGPRCLTTGNNNETIVVDDVGRILIYDKTGKVKKQWMMPETELGHPEGVWLLSDGKIAVSDTHYSRVVIFSPEGKVVQIFGKRGLKQGQFTNPVGIVQDPSGNLYICEYGKRNRVQKFTKDGKFLLAFGKTGISDGEFQRPSSVAWHQNKVYVADAVNNRIQVFSDKGKFIKVLGMESESPPKFYLPYDIKIDRNGFLYVIEYGNSRISKMNLDGEILGCYGSVGTERNQFRTPWGLTVQDNGRVIVGDTKNRRLVELIP